MFTLNSIPDKSSPKSQCLKLIIKKRRGTFVKQASWVNIRICCVENRTQNNRFLKEDICSCHMCSSFRISLVTCKLFPTCTHVKFVRTTNQRLWSPNCETGEIPFLQIQTETLPDPEHLVVMPSDVASSSQQWPKSPKRNTNVEFMLNIQVRSILNSWPGKISQHRQTAKEMIFQRFYRNMRDQKFVRLWVHILTEETLLELFLLHFWVRCFYFQLTTLCDQWVSFSTYKYFAI